MHDLAFADAARQAPVKILRLPMLPYSIGHEILLLAQRNSLAVLEEGEFARLPAEAQRSAVIRAALVCYRSWRENQRRERNLRLWGWLIQGSDWAFEVALFRNYRLAGSLGPPSPTQENYEIANGLQNEEAGREFGGSHLARLVDYFSTRAAGLGYETPYDVPLGFAEHVYLAALEAAGNYRIENGREAQVAAEMEGHRKAIAEEKSKVQSPKSNVEEPADLISQISDCRGEDHAGA